MTTEQVGIKATCDRKTKFWKNQRNTFGLLPGPEGTCPYATTSSGGCWYLAPGRKTHTCYVDSLMRAYKGIRGVLAHNTELLMKAPEDVARMTAILSTEFQRFKDVELRRETRQGHKPQMFYRLHWAGDIFNTQYSQAIANAVKQHSDIKFWIYTRTFDSVHPLLDIPNLVVYLSLDPANAEAGLQCYDEHQLANNLHVCYMAAENDFEQVKTTVSPILLGKEAIRKQLGGSTKTTEWLGATNLHDCPVDIGRLNMEGGCAACRRCVRNNGPQNPVWFKC